MMWELMWIDSGIFGDIVGDGLVMGIEGRVSNGNDRDSLLI